MLRFCRKLQNRSFFVKPGNLLRRSLAPANASPFSVASRREQKTPNLLPSGFSGCLPGPCSDGTPSRSEQKTWKTLPSGFGERLGGAGRVRQLYITPFTRTQNRPFCSRKTRGTTVTPGIRRGVTTFGDIQCHLAEGRCRRGQYGARGPSRCHWIWLILVTPGEVKLRRGRCRNGGLSRCHCFRRFLVPPRRGWVL